MDQTQEASSSISPEAEIKSKPGPKAKPKIDVEALLARVHNLEELIIRMAHQSGTAHAIIKKAGLTPYHPTQGDMSRFKVIGG